MSTPKKKRGPKALFSEESKNPKVLQAEKAKLEAQIKELEEEDLFLEEQLLLVLQQIQEKLNENDD